MVSLINFLWASELDLSWTWLGGGCGHVEDSLTFWGEVFLSSDLMLAEGQAQINLVIYPRSYSWGLSLDFCPVTAPSKLVQLSKCAWGVPDVIVPAPSPALGSHVPSSTPYSASANLYCLPWGRTVVVVVVWSSSQIHLRLHSGILQGFYVMNVTVTQVFLL